MAKTISEVEAVRELLLNESDEKIVADLKKTIWLLQQGIKPPPAWEWMARYTKPHPNLGYGSNARWHVTYNEYGDPVGMSYGDWLSDETRPPSPIVPAPALEPPPKLLRFPLPSHPESTSDARRRTVWAGTYAEYTATPEFARIADAARKEWNYQCLLGLNHKGRIEMHHRSYRNVPFREDWRDLIPLCEDCHGLYHGRLLKPPVGLFAEVELLDEAA